MEQSSHPAPYPENDLDARGRGEPSQLPLWPRSEETGPEGAEVAEPESHYPAQAFLPDPPWNIGDLIRFVLFLAAATIITMALAATGYSLLRDLFRWTEPAQEALNHVPAMLAIQLAIEGLGVLFIYLTITVKYQREFWGAIHWVRPPQGAFQFILTGAVMAVALNWLSNYFPADKQLPIEEWFSDTSSAYAVAVVGILAAPFIEELFFRGFLYPAFERRWGVTSAVVLTGALFAAIHGFQLAWSWREVSAIFLVGLILSYTRAKTRSLVPSYLMHTAYNSAIFVSVFVATDHFRNLHG